MKIRQNKDVKYSYFMDYTKMIRSISCNVFHVCNTISLRGFVIYFFSHETFNPGSLDDLSLCDHSPTFCGLFNRRLKECNGLITLLSVLHARVALQACAGPLKTAQYFLSFGVLFLYSRASNQHDCTFTTQIIFQFFFTND